MKNSIYRKDYQQFLGVLKEVRLEKQLHQSEVAESLNKPQSYISKCESGERRVDVVELKEICLAMGLSLTEFVKKLESRKDLG